MTQTKFLITGATGTTGGYAVRQLLEKSHIAVRVLAHRPDERSEQLKKVGVEVVFGDFPRVRRCACRAERVQPGLLLLSNQPGHRSGGRSDSHRLPRKPASRSSSTYCKKSARSDAKSEAARQHWLSERVFRLVGRSDGLPQADVLRGMAAPCADDPPGTDARSRLVVQGATPRSRLRIRPALSPAYCKNPGPHMGKTYPLFGPVELTQPEIAAIVGKVLGKEVKYEYVPIEKFAELRFADSNQPRRNTSAST